MTNKACHNSAWNTTCFLRRDRSWQSIRWSCSIYNFHSVKSSVLCTPIIINTADCIELGENKGSFLAHAKLKYWGICKSFICLQRCCALFSLGWRQWEGIYIEREKSTLHVRKNIQHKALTFYGGRWRWGGVGNPSWMKCLYHRKY